MAADQDWREVCTELSGQWSHLLENCSHRDCAFQVGDQGEIIQAHKVVLYRASSVFETMFYGSMPENQGAVKVTDIEPEIFKLLLMFIYTATLPDNLSDQDLMSLCLAANKYLVYNLRQTCINILATKVNVLNVWAVLKLADLLDNSVLYSGALKVIGDNAQQVFKHPKFLEISHKSLVVIVKEDNINISTEMALINACLLWAKHQCLLQGIGQHDDMIRQILGSEIISNIRFLTLTPDEFAVGPAVQNWLTADEKVSVFQSFTAPTKLELHANLCRNITKRTSYLEKLRVVERKNMDNSLKFPSGLTNYIFRLHNTKKLKEISYGGSSTLQKVLTFDKEVWIRDITIYSQTKNLTDKEKTLFRIVEGDRYCENIVLYLRHNTHRDHTNIVYTSSIESLTYYDTTIHHKIEPPVKFLRNENYIFELYFRKSGCYPVCDDIPLNSVFRVYHIDIKVPELSRVKNSDSVPIQSISFSC